MDDRFKTVLAAVLEMGLAAWERWNDDEEKIPFDGDHFADASLFIQLPELQALNEAEGTAVWETVFAVWNTIEDFSERLARNREELGIAA